MECRCGSLTGACLTLAWPCRYVPPCRTAPLDLKTDAGQRVPGNSFFVRGWGAVHVHRGFEKEFCSGRGLAADSLEYPGAGVPQSRVLMVNLQHALSAFRPCLLELMGVLVVAGNNAPNSLRGVTLMPGLGNGLAPWELQAVMQQR